MKLAILKIDENSKLAALVPLYVILFVSVIIYLLRYLDDLTHYNRNLSWFLPLLGIVYLGIFFWYIREEKLRLQETGLKPSKMKFSASLVLGIAGGIFFFMIYFGAHPNRGFPSGSQFFAFNLYFLFVSLTEELVFRVWALRCFQTAFSGGKAIALSALAYMIANLASVGRDLSSVVAGRIDLFLIIEMIVRTFVIGLILAVIYVLTKSIYGNLFFITFSNIPILYEIEGPAFQGNWLSGLISATGIIIFLVLLNLHVRYKPKVPAHPLPDPKMITS